MQQNTSRAKKIKIKCTPAKQPRRPVKGRKGLKRDHMKIKGRKLAPEFELFAPEEAKQQLFAPEFELFPPEDVTMMWPSVEDPHKTAEEAEELALWFSRCFNPIMEEEDHPTNVPIVSFPPSPPPSSSSPSSSSPSRDDSPGPEIWHILFKELEEMRDCGNDNIALDDYLN